MRQALAVTADANGARLRGRGLSTRSAAPPWLSRGLRLPNAGAFRMGGVLETSAGGLRALEAKCAGTLYGAQSVCRE